MQIVETYWSKPISVRLQSGLNRTFISVEDTLDFLENEWPTRLGEHYVRAVDLCRATLNRVAPAEAAREAVIAACIEARMALVMAQPAAHRHRSGSLHAV